MSEPGGIHDAEAPGIHDAFSPEHIGVVQFIQLSRIYDVLMTLLAEANPAKADELVKLHSVGAILGPTPVFSGTFLFDQINPNAAPAQASDTQT